jgi:transposase
MTDITAQMRSRRFLSRSAQAQRYGKSVRTIKRWGNDPRMAMPPEYSFHTPHRAEDELDAWDRSRVALKD